MKGTTIEKPPNNDAGVVNMLKHPINVLLLCLPFGIAAWVKQWDQLYCFWFNFFAMIPLAKIIGDATEELAAALKNDVLAGLLNATFGNAVEMVITIQTLRAGLYNVVKATLLGSVLSNTLLVLGMSFLCGGVWSMKDKPAPPSSRYVRDRSFAQGVAYEQLSSRDPAKGSDDFASSTADMLSKEGTGQELGFDREKIQTFSAFGALVNTSMLLISCLSFSLITIFNSVVSAGHPHDDELMRDTLLPLSRVASVIIMLAYVAYIVFQLFTHKEHMAAADGQDDDEDGDVMPIWLSCFILFVSTVLTAVSSEILVQAIEGVTKKARLSQHFIGIILLPIVGNACEHAAAVRFAVQDKLGLSVSIAVGSSTQIALFVVPFAVLIGWAFDRDMDLNFGMLNTSMITLSVIVVLSMVVDGHSNWLQGYLLCSVYSIIAVMYSYLPDHLDH